MSVGEHLEQYDYEYLLAQALDRVPDTVDKRLGSIIYDALAPACWELAGLYMHLRSAYLDTYIQTAGGAYLDERAAEQGITRRAATRAVKMGVFTATGGAPAVLQIGDRFAAAGLDAPVYQVTALYEASGVQTPGSYLLTCEVPGSSGNAYTGELLPVSYIGNLQAARMTDLVTPGRDEETDDELRARYIEAVNQKPFGGNAAWYRRELRELAGVGAVRIYPVWQGGGTVKCSVIGADKMPCSAELVAQIQEAVDPGSDGKGRGLAPIGHKVTVATPEIKTVDVSCRVRLSTGYEIGQLQALIENAVAAYLKQVREEWDKADELGRYESTVYLSQVMAAVLQVIGVANVSDVALCGRAEDLELANGAQRQEIPVLGVVTVA